MRGRPESLWYFAFFVGVKSLEDWVIRRKPLSCVADFDRLAAKGSSETIRVGTETSKI